MGIFDSLYPQYGGNGLLNIDPAQQYNYGGGADDWLSQLMRGDKSGGPYTPPPPMYSEPSGDPSGSQPYTPRPDPYNLSGVMPRQSDVIDTGSYAPKQQDAQGQDRPGSPFAQLASIFSGSGTAQATPQQTPAFGSGAQPVPFANMVPGGAPSQQAGVPMPTPRPQMQDIAPNGLDRNMTALPSQFASMDGTNPQNGNFPGYSPSPSALDAIPPNAQLAGPARQLVPAPTQEAPQSRGGLGDGFRGLMANAHNGPIGALLGGFAGAAGMGEGTPAQIAAQNQKQMFQGYQQLFMSRGMPQAQASSLAMIATMNPKVAEEMMKAPANYEASIVNPFLGASGAGGGSAPMDAYLKFERNKSAATKAGALEGESQATAELNLPGTLADSKQTMETIAALRNHKGRNSIGWHGFTASIPAETLRGSEAFGAIKLEDRLKARTFTDQVKTMVNMGALSNAEGSKITDAVASLDRGLKREEYDKALDFIEGALRNGIDKMSLKAGKEAPNGFRGSTINPGVYDWTPDGGMKQRGAK